MGPPGTVLVDPTQQPAYYSAPGDPNLHAPANFAPQVPIATQPVQYYPVQAEPRQAFSPRLVYEEDQEEEYYPPQ
jgi:hypothetical protein